MEQAAFKKSFPAFPIYEEAIDKLKLMLVQDKVFTQEEIDRINEKAQIPDDFVEELAMFSKVTPEILAKMEADILDIPFISSHNTKMLL